MLRLKSIGLAVFLLSALVMLPLAGRAQQSDRPGRPDLGLADGQKEQVKQIRNSQREQMEALRQDTSFGLEERRAKAREIRKNSRSQMESVLTPEQTEKLQKHRQELRNRHGRYDKHGGHRGPAGTARPEADGSPQ